MSEYTPINYWKCSKSGREFLDKAKLMAKTNVDKIHVNPRDFSDLLDSMSASARSFYSDAIPFEGKVLVRR